MDKLSVFAQCDCGAEIMEVEYWEDEKEFCFTQFRYAPIRYNFWGRVKFLFSGEVRFNEIILTPKEAKRIADYINLNIESNVKEAQKETKC